MPSTSALATNEMAILRRVVDPEEPFASEEVARAILRWSFSAADIRRMNRLAEKNRTGTLKPNEQQLLDSYIRVGQTLGILQSKARRSQGAARTSKSARP